MLYSSKHNIIQQYVTLVNVITLLSYILFRPLIFNRYNGTFSTCTVMVITLRAGPPYKQVKHLLEATKKLKKTHTKKKVVCVEFVGRITPHT